MLLWVLDTVLDRVLYTVLDRVLGMVLDRPLGTFLGMLLAGLGYPLLGSSYDLFERLF